MNDLGAPGGKDTPDDEILLADIGRFLDEFDPPPDDLVHRVQFALALETSTSRWRAGNPSSRSPADRAATPAMASI